MRGGILPPLFVKMGFVASRGADGLPSGLPLKPGEAILSGFLSPMERAVFKAGLAQRRPLICGGWKKARTRLRSAAPSRKAAC